MWRVPQHEVHRFVMKNARADESMMMDLTRELRLVVERRCGD